MSLAAFVSLGVCALAIWVGPRIGSVDRPDDPFLKAHQRPAVPLGGVGIFLGVHLAALTRGGLDLVLLAASAIVLVLGLVDDRRGIPPVIRLGFESVAAAVLVFGLAAPGASVLYLVLGMLVVLLTINAVNLLDGLDGLAGSVALVTGVGLAWLATVRGVDARASLELAGALAGFLVFNWHPARVFMGDAGAYVVGLTLAYLILNTAQEGTTDLLLTSGVLGLFAIDLTITMLRRRLNDQPLFAGDRSHIYDQLRDRGMSVKIIASGSAGFQILWVAGVVAADVLFNPLGGLVLVAGVAAALVVSLAGRGFLRATSPP